MTVAIDFPFAQEAVIKFQRGIDCTVRKSRRQMPTVVADFLQHGLGRITGSRIDDARGLQSRRNPEAVGSHQLPGRQPLAFLVVQTEALIGCSAIDEDSLIILYGLRLDGL
jgi:hypothetical protein